MLPGVGTKEDIKEAQNNGGSICRIATHCTEADVSIQHFGLARELGLETVGFLMMSHTIPPEKLAAQARIMADAGCQCVYVVDSAGALVLEGVADRVAALVAELGDDAQVGFHGHENLGLGVANSIEAVRAGAKQIDGSCRRFGAGAGNAPVEALIGVFDKIGVKTGIDFFDIADAAEEVVAPAMPAECLLDRNALIMGYSGCTPASSSTPSANPSATACPPTSCCTAPASASSSAARRTSSSTSRWRSSASRTAARRSPAEPADLTKSLLCAESSSRAGTGTRLHPISLGASKQLLPVYDKPMVYYPLTTLMLAGIRDVLVITTPEDVGAFGRLLGDGHQFGISITYAVQRSPDGLAQAFVIGRDHIGAESAALALGDNIFYGPGPRLTTPPLQRPSTAATIFAYRVANPSAYGVVEFDDQ